jgi:hypothetical protein
VSGSIGIRHASYGGVILIDHLLFHRFPGWRNVI